MIGVHLIESTTTTEATTTTTESGSTTESPTDGGDDSCPQTQPGQGVYVCPSAFKRDPNDCNLFYQCTQDDDSFDMTITKFMCPEGTVYDEDECKCVPAKDDDCKDSSRYSIDLRHFKYTEPPKNTVSLLAFEPLLVRLSEQNVFHLQ